MQRGDGLRKRNELETAMTIMKRLLKKMQKENPNAGFVLDRGEDTEERMSIKELSRSIGRVSSYFGDIGQQGYSMCGTCSYFKKNHQGIGEAFAECKNDKGKPGFVHCYDTCGNHSDYRRAYDKI